MEEDDVSFEDEDDPFAANTFTTGVERSVGLIAIDIMAAATIKIVSFVCT